MGGGSVVCCRSGGRGGFRTRKELGEKNKSNLSNSHQRFRLRGDAFWSIQNEVELVAKARVLIETTRPRLDPAGSFLSRFIPVSQRSTGLAPGARPISQ